VNLTGAQSIEIDPGTGVERDLLVGPIEPGAVTVAVYSDAARLTPGAAAELSDLRVELVSVADRDTVAALNAALVGAGVGVHALVPERSSLEDVFLSLVEGADVPR